MLALLSLVASPAGNCGGCYNANGDHKVECEKDGAASSSCGGTWLDNVASSCSGCVAEEEDAEEEEYKIGASDGSCYTGGLISCNVDNVTCAASNGFYYEPGTVSAYGSKCCHRRGGCAKAEATKEGCEDGAGSKDESKGACYNADGSHSVVCDVAESACAGTWYPPGATSSRSGCCFCETGCPKSLLQGSCTYYDHVETTSPPASPAVPCTPSSVVENEWTDGLNEACYKHDGVCEGYPVCCVTKGTCVSTHGGTILGTSAYYEGGCFSPSSSREVFGPGCGTKVGECNYVYLEEKQKATTAAGGMTPISAAVTARLTAITTSGGGEVCQIWDIVTYKVMLDDAPMTDFTGRFGKTDEICKAIA